MFIKDKHFCLAQSIVIVDDKSISYFQRINITVQFMTSRNILFADVYFSVQLNPTFIAIAMRTLACRDDLHRGGWKLKIKWRRQIHQNATFLRSRRTCLHLYHQHSSSQGFAINFTDSG